MSKTLSVSVKIISNESIAEGKATSDCRCANVTPVFKGRTEVMGITDQFPSHQFCVRFLSHSWRIYFLNTSSPTIFLASHNMAFILVSQQSLIWSNTLKLRSGILTKGGLYMLSPSTSPRRLIRSPTSVYRWNLLYLEFLGMFWLGSRIGQQTEYSVLF